MVVVNLFQTYSVIVSSTYWLLAVVLSKRRLSTRGRCYHAHWEGILIKGRHRHGVGDILIMGARL